MCVCGGGGGGGGGVMTEEGDEVDPTCVFQRGQGRHDSFSAALPVPSMLGGGHGAINALGISSPLRESRLCVFQ